MNHARIYGLTPPTSLDQVRAEVCRLAMPFAQARGRTRLPLVEVTGGEPLLQHNCPALLRLLCEEGFTVLLETDGALDISKVDPRVHRIVDLKCPASGEAHRNRRENLAHLRGTDEVKFVISSQQDHEWARQTVVQHQLAAICPVLFSRATPLAAGQYHPSLKPAPAGHLPISRQELAQRIVADALPVRFQLQMHKFIWPPAVRGV